MTFETLVDEVDELDELDELDENRDWLGVSAHKRYINQEGGFDFVRR